MLLGYNDDCEDSVDDSDRSQSAFDLQKLRQNRSTLHLICFNSVKDKVRMCCVAPLILISYEWWFIVTLILECFWLYLRLEFLISQPGDDKSNDLKYNRILSIPQVIGIIILIVYKLNSLRLRFDKYALTSTLYIAFTTHLTNFFFSIPAVLIDQFTYLKIDLIKSDWKTAVCIFMIGLVSVLDIWGLLLAVEQEDRKFHDEQEQLNSYKGKDNRPKKVTQ